MHGPLVYYGGGLLAIAASILLLYLLYLMVRAFWSLWRTRRCRQFAELAAKKEREGDLAGAIALYIKAESSWTLNAWDGGRESWSRDLDLLSSTCSGLVRALAREPGTAYRDLDATIREMREILRDRRNFGVDGRKMLPEVMVRWKVSIDRLNGLRSRLRDASNPKRVARR
jgi:hypothetical protein